MPSRRRTLALALLAGLPLAGCSALTGPGRSEPRARLDGVWLVNDRREPQTVRVTVTGSGDSGEPVFETTVRLGTAADPTPNDGNVVLEPSLAEPGRYAVSLSVGDGGEDPEATVDAARAVDGKEDCVLVRFTLTWGSGVRPRTKSYRRCGERTTP